jgi:hypothetical protein
VTRPTGARPPHPEGDDPRETPPRTRTRRGRLGRFLAGFAWPRASAGRSRAWLRHKLRGLGRALSPRGGGRRG